MSPRARSWLAGILFSLGVFAFFTGALFPGLAALAYAGGACAVAGLVVLGWALKDVGRQIAGNQARFEAILRSDIEKERKEQKPPADR